MRKPSRDEWKKLIGIAVGLAAFAGVFSIPLSPSLTSIGEVELTTPGKSTLAVLVFALALWISEAFPFYITGFLSIFLLTILKVGTFQEIIQLGFGNHIVVFMIGVLILSEAFRRSGLGRRVTLLLLTFSGNSTRRILLGFMLIGTALSMWLSNMAVAAMMVPPAVQILRDEGFVAGKSNFGRSLLIACAWGPTIGGIGTPSGAGPNPLTIGFLQELAGFDLTFLKWMWYGVPAALILVVPAWLVLQLFFPPETETLNKSSEQMRWDYREMPPLNGEEKITAVIFAVTVLLWLTSGPIARLMGISIPVSMTVMFTICFFFFPGLNRKLWVSIENGLSWSAILLVLSGIAMGMMLHKTGATRWLAALLMSGGSNVSPLLLIFIVILGVSLLKLILSSNSVTATIIVPLVIAFALIQDLEITKYTLPAAFASSLAFILVTSGPTNVIPYAAGYFSVSDMAKAGLVMTIIASLLLTGTMYGMNFLRMLLFRL